MKWTHIVIILLLLYIIFKLETQSRKSDAYGDPNLMALSDIGLNLGPMGNTESSISDMY